MNKKFLVIAFLILDINILYAYDCSTYENFNPTLLTEVYFNDSNFPDIDRKSYIVYNNKKYKNIISKERVLYNFNYNDFCIHFKRKSKNVLKYLPNKCFFEITMSCRDDNEDNNGMEDIKFQYICNNKFCKRTGLLNEGLIFDQETGDDVSEKMFHKTKSWDGSDFYDEIIEIE